VSALVSRARALLQRQEVRYLLVGGYNTVFGYGLFALSDTLFKSYVNYEIILVACQVVATINAYVFYRLLVFKPEGQVIRDFLRFSTVYVIALAVNLIALPVLVEGLGMNVLIGQAIVVGGTVCASYLAHKHFSFRRPATVSG
jgi:putative flippase GtrA